MGESTARQSTMADSDGHGIKELLQAEKQAADIVQEAKKKRQDKMKKAKEDAEREIAEYRKQREEQFEAYKAEHSTGGTSSSAALRTQTDAAVSALEAEAAKNRKNVVDLLVKYVTTVQAN